MRRILLALLLAAATAIPARAWLVQGTSVTPTYQVFLGGSTSNASGSADSFIPVNYGAQNVAAADKFTVFPLGGNISTMRVKVNGTAPTGAQTWTVTLLKNGSDTASECVINSGSSGTCSISATVSYSAGDYGAVRIRPANTPTSARIQVAFLFQPATPNDTVVSAFISGLSTSATQAQVPYTSASVGAVSTRRYPPLPDGGTIDKFYVAGIDPDNGAGTQSYAYTLDKNGSSAGSPPTCTVSDGATTCNDTSHSQSVAAADDVQVQSVPSNTPIAGISGYGYRFVPTTAGHFMLGYGTQNVDHATNTFYFPVTGASSGGVATESQAQLRALAMTIKNLYVKLGTAPGAGKSRAFTLRKGGVDTALTCTVSDTATTCNATGASISISDDDLLSVSDVPTGSPALSIVSFSMLATH